MSKLKGWRAWDKTIHETTLNNTKYLVIFRVYFVDRSSSAQGFADQNYFFKPLCQLSTTVIGVRLMSPAGQLIKKRPSGLTTYRFGAV